MEYICTDLTLIYMYTNDPPKFRMQLLTFQREMKVHGPLFTFNINLVDVQLLVLKYKGVNFVK